MVWGIIINLIFWPLIIYWIWKGIEGERETKRYLREYDKPENKFKRNIESLGLTLSFWEDRYKYPYVMTPYFISKENATPPSIPNYYAEYEFEDDELYQRTKAAKGRVEFDFYLTLKEKFGEDFICFGNYKVKGFFPDIIYMDSQNHLYIDIEIDEPYSIKTKEPIHYYDYIERQGFIDTNRERDKAFVNCGWTVVRFSEEQIFRNMAECVKVIEHIVCYWLQKESSYTKEQAESFLKPRWKLKDAQFMSDNNHRNVG